MGLPPGYCEARRNLLKKTKENKEEAEDVYKEKRRLESGSLRSLVRGATPLLSIVMDSTTTNYSALCACRGQRDAEKHGGVAFFSNQHYNILGARVTLDRLFARSRMSWSAGITFLRALNHASVTGELNELPFSLPFSSFFLHSLFSHSYTHIPVTQCFATLQLSAF